MKRRKIEGIEFTDDVPEQVVREEIEFQKKVLEDHYRSRFNIAEGHDLLKIREEKETLKQIIRDLQERVRELQDKVTCYELEVENLKYEMEDLRERTDE